MISMARSILRFLLIFVLVLAALTAAWTWISSGYGWTVGTLARPLFHWVETPDVSTVEMRGPEIWVLRDRSDGNPAPFTWFDRYAFFAVIPLVALLCASPGLGWRRRLIRVGIGIAGLLVVHVAYVVASVQLAYAAMGLRTVGPAAARMLDVWQIAVRILWEAAPILLWIALAGGAWKETLLRARPKNERNASPAPVRRAEVEGSR